MGEALHQASGEQWAAVCYFYSAYHLVRDGLLHSPLFDDFDASARRGLIPDDRYTERHKGRGRGPGGSREWGVNDLVAHLFGQTVLRPYQHLHEASIEVRYGDGLRDIARALQALIADLDTLQALHGAGRLSCSA